MLPILIALVAGLVTLAIVAAVRQEPEAKRVPVRIRDRRPRR